MGKFPDPEPVLLAIDDAGLELLPVLAPHAMAVRSSPLEHRDPFDRLLLAQAAVESCVLLTADDRILAAAGPQARDARR